MTDLTDLGVAALRDGVRKGEFSAREVADQFIVKVSRAKQLNAFIVETPDHAIAAAKEADAARAAGEALKPLAGVPIGMKDLFATRGVQTTAASHILEGFKPVYESTVSQKLWDAGAGERDGCQQKFDCLAGGAALRCGQFPARGGFHEKRDPAVWSVCRARFGSANAKCATDREVCADCRRLR